MIVLPIKKNWFDLIRVGAKLEEYRAITPRYRAIFQNAADDRDEFWVLLRNGYSRSAPSIRCRVRLSVGPGNPEWGAVPGNQYFVLSILEKE